MLVAVGDEILVEKAFGYATGDEEPLGRDELLGRVFARPLRSAPGTRYAYSNAGYSLLAAVLETVTTQSWQQYLRERLFSVAGLHHTGFFRDSVFQQLPVAIGHFNGTPTGNPANFAGPYSLHDHVVLDSAFTDRLFTRHVREEGGTWYGYGWTLSDGPLGRGHHP